MQKATLLLLSLLSLSFYQTLNAQNEDLDSGMRLTQCDFEPDAPAVVISDIGDAKFIQDEEYGFIIRFERQKRVKIFKEAAFDQAEVSIPLYKGKTTIEKATDIKAATYYFDGTKIESAYLDANQIFEEPINEHWYQKKFALPNVKEGCVIEFSYTVYTPYYRHLPDWEFQSDIPTIYSEYNVAMTPFYSYMYKAQGFSQFDVFESGKDKGLDRSFMGLTFQDMNYKFGMKNVKSFKDESYITSREDYIKKIDFQMSEFNHPNGYKKKIMTTWPELSKEFMEDSNFGKYINKTTKIGQKEFAYLKEKSEQEKVDEVLDYVKSNYKPNGYYGFYTYYSLKDFNKEKTGNVSNINLMALGILKGVGIQAEPVLISTRDNGKVRSNFPFSDQFNYVIILATIDGKQKLLDATDAYCPNNMLPARCYNGKGYIVKKDSESWININNTTPSLVSTTIKYKLNPETNNITGTGAIRNAGQPSISQRKSYSRNKDKFKKEIENNDLTLTKDISVTEVDDNSRIFKYDFDFESKVDNIDGQIIFAPFLKFPDQTNPFKQEKRELAIDIVYPITEGYQAEIEIPEGYMVEQLPESYNKNTENTQVSFSAVEVRKENKIVITAAVKLKKAVYPASSYTELKRLFNNVIEKFNQKIVVTKNEDVAESKQYLFR